ncbi:MAG: cobalamin B12-binding domain-containing protein [Pseudomonadota bacterium]
MSAPNKNSAQNRVRIFGGGTAALRKVIAIPLNRRTRSEPKATTAFNSCATQDPVNSVLESDIIPRLLMAHMIDGSIRPLEEDSVIDAEDTQRFATLPLRLEAPSLLEEVDRFLEQGVSVEEVYLELLAPAARRLGEMWDADECDFVDVTMGLWRLQEVMREISQRFPPRGTQTDAPRSALFCPIPGDTHCFGAQMIEEVFARAGWQTDVLLKPERRELLDYLSRTPVDLVGLTVSCDCPAAALSSLIKGIRGVAMNPHLTVLVGGHMINANPGLVAEIGADGTGADARAALEVSERLVAAAPARAHTFI